VITREVGDGKCTPGAHGGYNCDYATEPLRDCANSDERCDEATCVECVEDIDCVPGTCDVREGVCVYPTWSVNWCRLQWPLGVTLEPSASAEIYARVFIPGLTDVNRSGNDVDPYGQVLAQVGYGPEGSLPDASWFWNPGAPNADYVVEGNPGGAEPDNDEYVATLTAPQAPGRRSYAFRFSGDGGLTWLLCDSDGVVPDGEAPLDYDPEAAGALTVREPIEVRTTLYEQNFDNLAGASEETVAAFNGRLKDWVLRNMNGAAGISTGTLTKGGIYSYGASGAPDRCLGGQASGTTGAQHWGFCWTNQTSFTWSDLRLAFAGEQWRSAGAPTAGLPFPHALTASWTRSGTGNPITGDLNATNLAAAVGADPRAGWVRVPELTFNSPVFGGTASALDGNQSAQRAALGHRFGAVRLAPGETVCFRWEDLDDPGTDHGLGIDDLILEGIRFE